MMSAYYSILLAMWICAPIVFFYLLRVPAPYGRHSKTNALATLNTTLAWIIMESPSAIVMGSMFFFEGRNSNSVVNFLMAMWLFHYLYRTCVFPFRIRRSNKGVAISVAVGGFFFNTLNAGVNGYFLNFLSHFEISWWSSAHFIFGVTLFFVGWWLNFNSDNILIALRRAHGEGYHLPQGGAFKWISCPNYLGEIIEWFGWALATWSLPGLTFAVFTVANLVPRAVAHHRWYQEHFPNYPKDRKALFNFGF